MGKGILSAIAQVFPDKPDFICHFHFLRDIGKDLMEDDYKKIGDRLKKHKVRGSLRRIAKGLEGAVVQDCRVMEMLKAGITKGDVPTFAEMPSASAFALIHWAFDISAGVICDLTKTRPFTACLWPCSLASESHMWALI